MADTEKTPLLSWNFPEFTRYERSRGWYIGFFAFFVVCITIAFFITDLPFIGVLVLAALVIIIRLRRTPQLVSFIVHEDGVTIGDRNYTWSDFKHFWILYKPPHVKQLYLEFKSGIRPAHNISLEDQNPLKVREVLRDFLIEDIHREEEPLSEQLTRYFKI